MKQLQEGVWVIQHGPACDPSCTEHYTKMMGIVAAMYMAVAATFVVVTAVAAVGAQENGPSKKKEIPETQKLQNSANPRTHRTSADIVLGNTTTQMNIATLKSFILIL